MVTPFYQDSCGALIAMIFILLFLFYGTYHAIKYLRQEAAHDRAVFKKYKSKFPKPSIDPEYKKLQSQKIRSGE